MGIISTTTINRELLQAASKTQLHRGPDAQQIRYYSTPQWNFAFGHQRLSILDLSESGTQPMEYSDGSGSIIYNGEVYNYREMRKELEREGCTFRSETDTEVILTALHQWGIEKAIGKFNGMWAFAWYDKIHNRIVFARDRLGVKPLHFYMEDNQFYFASEVKTILNMVKRKFSINLQTFGEYLFQSLLETSTKTFFEKIEKLPAAHYGVLDLSEEKINLKLSRYWDVPLNPIEVHNEADLAEEVRELFLDSVRLQLRSDVPMGVLLSGGLDSSSIASAMQKIMGRDAELNLISAVSNDARYNESPHIDKMSAYLNLPVHKVNLKFSPKQALKLLERVCWHNDEPVGSFSNVAHFLLMEKAKELGITVILSGQGADELLCGYRKYLGFYIKDLINRKKYADAVRTAYSFWKNGTVINQFSFSDAKRYLPSFVQRGHIDISGDAIKHYHSVELGMTREMSVQERQIADLTRYSIPALTHFEDRISMSWSREVRVPFLDNRLVEKLIPLPIEWKLNKGWTKYIFRHSMKSMLPEEILWRKDKQGFGIPQETWLKHELRDEVRNIFHDDCLMYKMGLVKKERLIKLYNTYCNQPQGKGTLGYKDVFNPLAIEIWLRQFENHLSN